MKTRFILRTISFAVLSAFSSLCGLPRSFAADPVLHVSAAASLRETITEISRRFEKEHPGLQVKLNLGASNLLARQIIEGAPADVIIAAGAKPMDQLQAKALIDKSSRLDLLGNTLVAVVPSDSAFEPRNESDLKAPALARIAIAESAVPAGTYAEAYLKGRDLWNGLEGRVVRTANVRATLATVEEGHAQLGWVYATDAATTSKVKIVWRAPKDPADPIVYPAALVSNSASSDLGRQFMAFLKNSQSRETFIRAGFEFLPAIAPQ